MGAAPPLLLCMLRVHVAAAAEGQVACLGRGPSSASAGCLRDFALDVPHSMMHRQGARAAVHERGGPSASGGHIVTPKSLLRAAGWGGALLPLLPPACPTLIALSSGYSHCCVLHVAPTFRSVLMCRLYIEEQQFNASPSCSNKAAATAAAASVFSCMLHH